MDTFTHGLIGAAVAQAGLRQRWGVPATVATVIGATLPDADVLLGQLDPLYAMLYHRSFTHSLVMLPVTAAVCAAPAWLYARHQSGKTSNADAPAHTPTYTALWLCAAIGVFIQSIPDWITNYGTQLLWPLSHERFALDWIFIIDLTYTGLALAILIVVGQIRRRRRVAAGLRVGQIGVALFVLYNLACAFAHERAAMALDSYLQTHMITPVRVAAYPRPFTLMQWGLMYSREDERGFATYYADYRLGEPLPTLWTRLEHPTSARDRALLAAAADERAVRVFYWFADFPQTQIRDTPDGGWALTYFDLRFYMNEPWAPYQLLTDGRRVHGFTVFLTPDKVVRDVWFLD